MLLGWLNHLVDRGNLAGLLVPREEVCSNEGDDLREVVPKVR